MKRMLPASHRRWWKLVLFKCSYCRTVFPRFGQLLSHLNRHTGVPYACDDCQKVFHNFLVYQLHRHVFHAEKKPLISEICLSRCVRRPASRQHFKTKKRKPGIPAETLQELQGKESMKDMVATPKRNVRIAAKSQSTSSTALSGRTGTGNLSNAAATGFNTVKIYSCPCCTETFTVLRQLKQHLRNHEDDRPFRCMECDKRYKQNAHLMVHVRTVHEGRRPYECPDCGKTFARRSHLVAHGVTHSGERRFQCQLCDRRFAHRFLLTAHEQAHSGERRHRCTYCQKQFLRSCDLTSHTLRHTGLGPRRTVAAGDSDSDLVKPSSKQVTPPESRTSCGARSKVC